MTTALFVAAVYVGMAWATWGFLTRPLASLGRNDRIYCLLASALWPAIPAVIIIMILIPHRARRIS